MDEQVFKEFMKRRFPHERDESYIEEWRGRFWSGRPEVYMDNQSLEVYKRVLNTVQTGKF